MVVNIPKETIYSLLRDGGINNDSVRDICIRCYSLYPDEITYLDQTVLQVYETLIYSKSDVVEAFSNIGAYCNPDKLITDLLYNYNVITKVLDPYITQTVKNIKFQSMNGGVKFYVEYSN